MLDLADRGVELVDDLARDELALREIEAEDVLDPHALAGGAGEACGVVAARSASSGWSVSPASHLLFKSTRVRLKYPLGLFGATEGERLVGEAADERERAERGDPESGDERAHRDDGRVLEDLFGRARVGDDVGRARGRRAVARAGCAAGVAARPRPRSERPVIDVRLQVLHRSRPVVRGRGRRRAEALVDAVEGHLLAADFDDVAVLQPEDFAASSSR